MVSESVLFQMLLKVCSKLNWSKIDQSSKSFSQFRQMLIQVSSHASQLDGQNNEDKSKDYLEKQLIESWERIIDRNEAKNLELYCPKEHTAESDDKISLDLRAEKDADPGSKPAASQTEKAADLLGAAVSPFIDIDYVQPVSSYLKGLPEPTVKKN